MLPAFCEASTPVELTIQDAPSQPLNIVGGDCLRVGKSHGNLHWHCHFIDAQIGIWRDDCASGKVDSLAAEITPEASLLPLQPLYKASAQMIKTFK